MRKILGGAAAAALITFGFAGTAAAKDQYITEDKDGTLHLPMLIVGPTWGIRYPFMIVGIGLNAEFHMPKLVHVRGTFMYGMTLEKDDKGSYASTFMELFGGYPLFNWNGTKSGGHADAQYSTGTHNVTEYHNKTTETAESLIVEGGFFMGSRRFNIQGKPTAGVAGAPGTAERIESTHRVLFLSAGIRWMWAWEYGNTRNHSSLFVHLIAPGIRSLKEPNGGIDKVFVGDNEESKRPVGVRAGMQLVAWLNAFATLDAEVAYLPNSGTWFFSFGNTFPIWFM